VQLSKIRHTKVPDWYKGPARLQDKLLPSFVDSLFSKSNRYKGKFLPIHANQKRIETFPGPTTYFKELISQEKPLQKNPLLGFLSSTERFSKIKNSISHIGPASYKADTCHQLCSKKQK